MPRHHRATGRRFVLDANALIGFFEGQTGTAEKVRQLMGEALRQDEPLLMSAVNWGEVFYILWRHRGESTAYEAETRVLQLPVNIIGVDRERASRAAALKQEHDLGYADAFAAELALERESALVTADPELARVGKALRIYALPGYQK